MKLKNIGPNCQEVTENTGENTEKITLFSYGVEVARKISDGCGYRFALGEKWDYSRTTAKHVSRFFGMTTKEIRKEEKEGNFDYF